MDDGIRGLIRDTLGNTSGKDKVLTKVHLVKAMVFPVVVCGCESWTINKA